MRHHFKIRVTYPSGLNYAFTVLAVDAVDAIREAWTYFSEKNPDGIKLTVEGN